MPLRSALLATALSAASVLPAGTPVETRAPDVAAELREFAPSPPGWSADVVDAVLGHGSIAQEERRSGWLAQPENWELVDYVDRAYNYTTHGWLAHRGIAAEHYGYNEFQETMSQGALALLGERGLARGPMGELLTVKYPTTGRGFVADPLEPRWSAILAYDQSTSPLLGDAISQDNIGSAQGGMGPSALGRFGDAAQRGFASWRAQRGEPAVAPIRSYLRAHFAESLAALRPYAPLGRFDPRRADAAARALCDDPVLAEYQIFHTAASLASWARLYTNLRQIAERAGRAFDVHGNLGGGPTGLDPYPYALAGLVDTVWFETSGMAQYDQALHGWWNAWGALRLELAEAVADGRNVMFLAHPDKQTPDFVAQEMAEISAGGGVPLVSPDMLLHEAPEALPEFTEIMRLRDRHRGVFARTGRERLADVALLYSVGSVLFDQCVPEASSSDTPVLNDFSGAARVLEEMHEPFDVVVLPHPELAPARIPAPDLARYRLVIAPSLERLSDADLARLTRYLRGGGTLAVLGKIGVRDEHNRARSAAPVAQLRAAGRVQLLLGGASFSASRVTPSAQLLALGARAQRELRALLPAARVGGELRPSTWVTTWRHAGGFVSAHFVSYAIDFASGTAQPAPAARFGLRLPRDVRAESARWIAPDEPERELPLRVEAGVAWVALPPLRVYGVLVLGPRGGEARASALARGDRRLARARMAGAGTAGLEARLAAVAALRARDPERYDAAAGELLRALSAERERAYIETVQDFASFDSPVAAFAFGQNADVRPFSAVRADTEYSKTLGYG
ncbi:MAG TPA: beta-galactosidase trimerization domain-containing protein, partial [Myxococcota bacterium]|nr:beta-galactosidase trimerization domain-containing protein [Myxococcota bacterium]